jgi:hypothetical protein
LAGGKSGPDVLPFRDREQAVFQEAEHLAEAVAQFVLDWEQEVLSRAEKVRVATAIDIEKQRASVESLVGLLAERLRRHEEVLSSIQEQLQATHLRLTAHADAFRSLSAMQAHHDALLSQFREVLRSLRDVVEGPANPPPIPR